MSTWTNESDTYRDDEQDDAERFERFSHRQQGPCPVRSHTSRTKAMMRSRGGTGARQKAHSMNGAHRRCRYKRAAPSF
jgi:hypothetical protein